MAASFSLYFFFLLLIYRTFVQQEGEGYLDLRKENDCAFEDQYLQPDSAVPLTPGSPTSIENQLRIPLPTIPDEAENEVQKVNSAPDEENKKAFVLGKPPKGKRVQRMDSELEKVQRDTQEKETLKSSGSSSADDDILEEGEMNDISEKEQSKFEDDEDKDVCERNSGVFDSPPPYEPKTDNIMFCAENPLKDMQVKMGGGQRNRQLSNRYISS